MTDAELRAYLKGLMESGEMDGYAYAEIVPPAKVLALLDRIAKLERMVEDAKEAAAVVILALIDRVREMEARGNPPELAAVYYMERP